MQLEKPQKTLLAVTAVVALGACVLWVAAGDRNPKDALVSTAPTIRRVRPVTDAPTVTPRAPRPNPVAAPPPERPTRPSNDPAPGPGRRPRNPSDSPTPIKNKPLPGC